MTSHRHQTDATKHAVAIIVIAVVIAIRELYVRGSDEDCLIGLLLLLIPPLILRLKIRTKSPLSNEHNADNN